MSPINQLLTTKEVAEKLQLHKNTVNDYLKEGRLKGVKLGRVWRVKPEDLDEFITSLQK